MVFKEWKVCICPKSQICGLRHIPIVSLYFCLGTITALERSEANSHFSVEMPFYKLVKIFLPKP